MSNNPPDASNGKLRKLLPAPLSVKSTEIVFGNRTAIPSVHRSMLPARRAKHCDGPKTIIPRSRFTPD